jgi:hypothetical protein
VRTHCRVPPALKPFLPGLVGPAAHLASLWCGPCGLGSRWLGRPWGSRFPCCSRFWAAHATMDLPLLCAAPPSLPPRLGFPARAAANAFQWRADRRWGFLGGAKAACEHAVSSSHPLKIYCIVVATQPLWSLWGPRAAAGATGATGTSAAAAACPACRVLRCAFAPLAWAGALALGAHLQRCCL